MTDRIIDCGNGFWNIRGTFRIGGLLDVGTQASLVRLADGRFLFLDSYTLSPELQSQVDAITGGRAAVAAVINTHPFHTLHVPAMQAAYPAALHYGTTRHHRLFPDLAWADTASEDPQTWAAFAPDLDFTVPAGIQLIPENERIHCGTVLAWHPASRTIHVDDTFNYRPPGWLRRKGRISVHPTLRFALEKRAGAAEAFRAWGAALRARWPDPRWICTAHNGALQASDLAGGIDGAIRSALARAEPVLKRHAANYG